MRESPPISYFAELLFAMFAGMPNVRRPAVSILSAYCDDSATHNPSTAVTIGGGMTDSLTWIALSYEWQKLMEKWEIPFFHMADFESRRPPFDWPEDVRRDRLNALLDIIEFYEVPLFGCSVELATYKHAVSKMSDEHWGGPYGLTAECTLIMQANQAREYLESKDATVAYFFEHGVKGWGQIEKAFNNVIGHPKWRLQAISRVPKEGVPPIQVADIVAYEWTKEFARERGLPGAPPKKRYPLKRLENNPHFRAYVLEETMELMSEAIDNGMAEIILDAALKGRKKGTGHVVFGERPRGRVVLPREIQDIVDKFRYK